MRCEHCPVPEGEECKSYPALCANFARNPERWRPVLDRINDHLPPIEAATRVAHAAESAMALAASGLTASGKDEAARRHAICRACPHGLYDAATDRCRECSCVMKVKTSILGFRCPRREW